MTDNDEIADIIEIRVPEIEQNKIISRLRDRLAELPESPDIHFPSFSFDNSSIDKNDHFPPEVHHHLTQATRAYDQIWVEPRPIPTTAPLIGRLLTRLKQELHNLVTYYVNLLAGRQATFNEHIVRAVSGIVTAISSDRAALEARLAHLEQRVAQLEAAQKTGEDPPERK